MRSVRTPTIDDVRRARDVISRHLPTSPVVRRQVHGHDVALKLETLQPTGSFKVRGAIAAVDAAMAIDPSQHFVTASAGNHGLGVAFAATAYGAAATVVIPQNASAVKKAALQEFDISLVEVGSSYHDAEAHALQLADAGATFISPYNDPGTVAGQGSIALELFEQVPELRTIVVPIGGGGLSSGVALAASPRTDVRVVGVQAAASPAISAALESGGIVAIDIAPTLADGLAGNLEPGSITVELIRQHVDEIITVSENEIAEGIRHLAFEHGLVVEGSAAVGIAALKTMRVDSNAPTAVVLTGRNIARDALARVLSDPR